MGCHKSHKKGNITIILLGLISVMLVLVMALSKRMTGHTQLLTLSDYTQITRYFLESYAGDILQQINIDVNQPDSELFATFRRLPSPGKLSTGFYKPSAMLKKLGEELKIQLQLPPEIVFSKAEELEYPPGFDCPNQLKGKEKKGLLEIVCKARFQGREYTLTVQYPFTVVMRMLPIFKDFMMFADRIALEQGNEKIGPDDNINVLFTRDGKHPYELENGILSHNSIRPGFKYRPMILLPPLDMTEYTDANLTGRVFMGPADKSVFLNLAGDTREQANNQSATTASDEVNASVGEMFLVSPETFKVADDTTEYGYIPVFMNRKGEFIRMMGLNVPLKYGHTAKMGLLGFSYEIIPDSGGEGIFSGAAYTAGDFFNSGGRSSEFWQKLEGYGKGYMAMASGIKLMGPKPDNFQLGHTNRQVFGNVLSRFFVLTFWWPPSGGGEPLQYDDNRGPGNFPEREVFGSVTYTFEPAKSEQKYQDFMSRMVSGKNFKPTGSSAKLPDGFMAYNSDISQKSKRIFTDVDFKANDGFLAKSHLDKLGQSWFQVENSEEKFGKGAEARVGRSFASGKDFLDAAGIDKGQFNVNGVVYVAGPLKVPALNMTNDKIGGGIVLVDGPIELENITRGYNIDTNQFKLGKYGNMLFSGSAYDYYQKWKKEITQENFLTFVSLRGDPIVIKGEALIGVHLVNLYDQYNRPYSQIKWASGSSKEIVFCGGIACNYLDLPERMKEFGNIKSSCNLLRAPFFMYHSAMSAAEPSYAVQMMENMRGYMLTAARTGKDD